MGRDAQLCWQTSVDEWGALDIPRILVAGDGRGIGGAAAAALQGDWRASPAPIQLGKLDAATRDRLAAPLRSALRRHLRIRPFPDALYRPKPAHRMPADDVIFCRCEEVCDIRGFVGLGCTGPNQAKAFGRCGMGPCRGRQCGLTVTELIAEARGVSPAQVGYYRIRPPIKPVTLWELARDA